MDRPTVNAISDVWPQCNEIGYRSIGTVRVGMLGAPVPCILPKGHEHDGTPWHTSADGMRWQRQAT